MKVLYYDVIRYEEMEKEIKATKVSPGRGPLPVGFRLHQPSDAP